MGSAVGATTRLEDEYVVVSDHGRHWVVDSALRQLASSTRRWCRAAWPPRWPCRFGAHGPAAVISTGCTSGLDAVGYGHQLIEDGDADVVIAGATDAPISPISMACFDAIRATSARNDDPEHASRPFDATRDGFVMGEGARGADPRGVRARPPRGARHLLRDRRLRQPLQRVPHDRAAAGRRRDGRGDQRGAAARRASIPTASATSTRTARAPSRTTGTRRPRSSAASVSTPTTSRSARSSRWSATRSGAIGAIELAACVLAIRHGVVPPTANLENQDPECDLDYVPRRPRAISASTSRCRSAAASAASSPPSCCSCRDGECVHDARGGHRHRDRRTRAVSAPRSIWRSTLAGELRVRPIDTLRRQRYGTSWPGRSTGFDRRAEHVDPRLVIQTDRWTWMSLAAAQLALDDAKYDPAAHDPYATSVVLSGGSGGNEFGQREIQALWSQGRQRGDARTSRSPGSTPPAPGRPRSCTAPRARPRCWSPRVPAGSTAWAPPAGSSGAAPQPCIAGGTEAPLSPYALVCQIRSGRMTTQPDPRDGLPAVRRRTPTGTRPARAVRCWWSRTTRLRAERGAQQIYGEIAGYAATHDAHHHEDPAPDCAAARRGRCGGRSTTPGVTPDEVELVIADGAGHPRPGRAGGGGDPHGVRRAAPVPVTAPQGFVGRLCSGGAALNVATALLAMRDGIVPAVGNLDQPVPGTGLDLVRRAARTAQSDVVLVNARGFGGFNSCMVLQALSGGRAVTDNDDRPCARSCGCGCAKGARTQFESAWRHAADEISRVPGNLRQELIRDADDPRTFVITSEWTDQEALDAFGRSAARDRLTAALRDLRESAEPQHLRGAARRRRRRRRGSGCVGHGRPCRTGEEEAYERAYRKVAERMRGTPGHIREELLREPGTATYHLFAEWESEAAFNAWVDDPSHMDQTAPLLPYLLESFERTHVRDRRPARRTCPARRSRARARSAAPAPQPALARAAAAPRPAPQPVPSRRREAVPDPTQCTRSHAAHGSAAAQFDTDVLVVGAGPAGLTARHRAGPARRRLPARSRSAPSRRSQADKAIGIQCRTMEIWENIGVVREAMDAGHLAARPDRVRQRPADPPGRLGPARASVRPPGPAAVRDRAASSPAASAGTACGSSGAWS